MLITDKIFYAFLVCENKAYLKLLGNVGSQREFTIWEQNRFDAFKQKCLEKLRSEFGKYESRLDILSSQDLEKNKCHFIVDYMLETQEFQSHTHVLERCMTSNNTNFLIPIRFVPNEKITKNDKLLLSFDAFILSIAFNKMPVFGKIMYGIQKKTVKVEFARLMELTKTVIKNITAQYTNLTPPQLTLKKHCPECEFQLRCRQIAIEKDDLTLLPGMTGK